MLGLRITILVILNDWVIIILIFRLIILKLIMINYKLIFILGGFYFDRLVFILVILTLWIIILCIIRNIIFKWYLNNFHFFIVLRLAIFYRLYLRFIRHNLLMFYIFFEFSFLFIFLIVLGWGYRPERLQASMYIIFYTLLVSLPFLIGLFIIINLYTSLNYFYLYTILNYNVYIYWWYFLILVFLVKLPMFLVHLWLPKAHVEAPLGGSIILAGVLLKLGGYGLIRIIALIFTNIMKLNYWLIRLGLIGSLLVRLLCIRQYDIKALIAYSSVAHIGLVIGGLFSCQFNSYWGRLIIMFAHGLCSSGLFCLVIIIYERFISRRFIILKGAINYLPLMRFWWFIFCIINIGAPPFLNFFSEVLILLGCVSWRFSLIIIFIFLLFLSRVYSIYLFIRVNHGNSIINYNYKNISSMEFLVLLLHITPLLLLITKIDFFF